MTISAINTGSAVNDGTGDPLRTAFGKANQAIAQVNAHTAVLGSDGNPATARIALGLGGAIISYTDRGTWATATAYSVNDLVRQSGYAYVVMTAHTSGTFSTDLAAGKLALHQGITREELAASSGAAQVGHGATTVAAGLDALEAEVTAPRPVVYGGTGASTASGALHNLGLIDVASPIVITATTTLDSTALYREVLMTDSGTPVEFGIFLPTGAPVGSMVFVRVARSGTKRYYVNSSDTTVDGLPYRIMWRGESALLLRETDGWTKISGVTIPFAGGLLRSTNQSITAGSHAQVAFDQAFGDPSGLNLSYNTSAQNFKCQRPGNYLFAAGAPISGTTLSGALVQLSITRGSPTPIAPPTAQTAVVAGPSNLVIALNVMGMFTCALNDAVGVLGFVSSPGAGLRFDVVTGVQQPTLTYTEIPSW